jgi:hypothetical protein
MSKKEEEPCPSCTRCPDCGLMVHEDKPTMHHGSCRHFPGNPNARLKEVQYSHAQRVGNKPVYGPMCPHCGALTEQSVIPCPDGPREIAPGVWAACAVLHIGWACRCCSPTRYFTEDA